MNLDMMKMKSASLFCNKLWQAARFLMMAWERSTEKMWSLDMAREADTLRPEDRWILSCCALTVRDVNEELARANFHMVTRSMRKLFYSHICDTYLVRFCELDEGVDACSITEILFAGTMQTPSARQPPP